jgi:hypothetical protein
VKRRPPPFEVHVLKGSPWQRTPLTSRVSPAAWWATCGQFGHFGSYAEARGAFKLAYQQGYDGLGSSVGGWMGLSSEQFDAWMRNDGIPVPQRVLAQWRRNEREALGQGGRHAFGWDGICLFCGFRRTGSGQ